MRRSRDGIDHLYAPTVALTETVRGYDRHHRQALAALAESVRQFERLRIDMEDFQLGEDLDALDEANPYENWLREEPVEHEVHLCVLPDNALQEQIGWQTPTIGSVVLRVEVADDALEWGTLFLNDGTAVPVPEISFLLVVYDSEGRE